MWIRLNHYLNALFIPLCITVQLCTAQIINEKVEQSYILDNHLITVEVQCIVKNKGNHPLRTYHFAVDPHHEDRVSYLLGGTEVSRMSLLERLPHPDDSVSLNQTFMYRLRLSKPIDSGEDITLFFKYVLLDVLVPFPRTIHQTEPQFVQFQFSPFLFSPYKTTSQSTVLSIGSRKVVSYSKDPGPVERSRDSVIYGPFYDEESFTQRTCVIHYENSQRFVKIESLEREIKVSNWGQISLADRVHIVHNGAKLDNGFSRLEYMQMIPKPTAVASFITTLPRHASNIYYRDDVGNISTSSLNFASNKAVLLELSPRFPLFGGWQTLYNIGYDLPAFRYLRNYGSTYVAKVRIVDHVMSDMQVEHLKLKIILPEMSNNIAIKSTSIPLNYTCNSVTFSYLDTIGRPTCTVELSKITNWHSQFVEVQYTLDNLFLWRKPVYASFATLLLFVAAMVFVRIDLSIVKDEKREKQMKLNAEWDVVKEKMLNIEWLQSKVVSAIKQFDENRTFTELENDRKKFEMECKRCINDVSNISSGSLLNESKVHLAKISTFAECGNKIRDSYRTLCRSADTFTNGKLSKAGYNQQKKETLQTIEGAVSTIIESLR